jgi:hypothetical protein
MSRWLLGLVAVVACLGFATAAPALDVQVNKALVGQNVFVPAGSVGDLQQVWLDRQDPTDQSRMVLRVLFLGVPLYAAPGAALLPEVFNLSVSDIVAK